MCASTAVGTAISMIVSTGLKMASEAQATNHESRELEREAKIARAQGLEEERRLRQQSARERAKRRVSYLKGGVTTEGSATDVLTDAAREDDVAARWARFGQTEAARAKEREARYRRRRSILDQLSATSSLGSDLIPLEPWKER
jgi:hypothetical protein